MTNKCVAFIGATGATSGTAVAHVVQHHCGRSQPPALLHCWASLHWRQTNKRTEPSHNVPDLWQGPNKLKTDQQVYETENSQRWSLAWVTALRPSLAVPTWTFPSLSTQLHVDRTSCSCLDRALPKHNHLSATQLLPMKLHCVPKNWKTQTSNFHRANFHRVVR